jgi:large subunit ribosomal protein L18
MIKNKIRRKERSRYNLKLRNKSNRLRLSFYVSNKYVYGQVVNDELGKTLFSASTKSEAFADKKSKKNIEAAELLGESMAKILKEKGIIEVCFDRGDKIYHGKVKAFADSARKNGLIF